MPESRALVTGGAGFVGSQLAGELLKRGWSVDVIDDLSTGTTRNLARMTDHPRFFHTIDSVMNRPLLEKLVARADVVFHLAAAVGVQLVVDRPLHTLRTNVGATELVLELAAQYGRGVLIASSSEVYGKSTKNLFHEDDDVVLGPTSRARWSYAASKMLDEFLALAYVKETRLPVTIVRLFNTIGPGQSERYGMVVPRFVRQALLGEPITVYGDGTQTRCFGWVGDVVCAMIDLMGCPDAAGEVFNVGHSKEIRIRDLAVLVREMTNSRSEILFLRYEDAYSADFEDMARRRPALHKIARTIGYRPSRDLPQMLEPIIADWRVRLGMTGAARHDEPRAPVHAAMLVAD